MNYCQECLTAKDISSCTESLTIGTATADTAYAVYVKNLSTQRVDVFETVSTAEGLIIIATAGYVFNEGNPYELWVTLEDASPNEHEEIIIGDFTTTCIDFSAIAYKSANDGCPKVIVDEILIPAEDSQDFVASDCVCVTEEDVNNWNSITGGGGETLSGTYAAIQTALTAGIDTSVYDKVLITDFQTIYDQPDFDNAGAPKAPVTKTGSIEPLLIPLLSANKLQPNAYSALFPYDLIQYDITFTATEVNGTPAKGRITERIDHLKNRTDYDHRKILFLRYESAPASGIFNSYKDNGGASQEFTTFQFAQEISDNPVTQPEGYSNSNYIGNYALLYSLFSNPFLLSNNVFGAYAEANVTHSYFANNTFADGSQGNEFNFHFLRNIIGSSFNSNIFKGNSDSNVFGNNCIANVFEYDCSNNVFGNNATGNNFNYGCSSNIFVDDLRDNVFTYTISGNDFTLATHVYATYYCELFLNAALVQRLRYIDAADALVVVNVTT